MDVREKLALVVCEATQKTNYKCEFDCKTKGKCAYCLVMAEQMIAHGVTVQERGNWKYYNKQNKAVCTNCSFERDLDANFGKAIICPNCGAYMPQPPKGE